MKKVCIQVGHYGTENLTSEGLRDWRDVATLRSATGASGERDYHWNLVMPKLRDKLIAVGVQVYIVGATYNAEIYNQDYDLWIALHYDGGGTTERCMVSAPNRATLPAYLHETAQTNAEKFCQIWKTTYPSLVGVLYREDFVTPGMTDYYAYDYVGMDTPAVIVEHFNWTAARGAQLKNDPNTVADADFKVICKFLGIPDQPPVTKNVYQIVYKGQVLQEYDTNPTDRINELSSKLEGVTNQVASLTAQVGTLQADFNSVSSLNAEFKANLATASRERDDAKSALATAEQKLLNANNTIGDLTKKIAALEVADPISAYSGWDLVMKGIEKMFKKK